MNLSRAYLVTLVVAGLGVAMLAQQQPSSPTGGITLANQVPVSGRTGQNGSVTPQQSAVPGTTQSVNTLNATVSVQGPYAQSVLSGNPLAGKLRPGMSVVATILTDTQTGEAMAPVAKAP